MKRFALLVGDARADPLIAPLESALQETSFATRVLPSASLADVVVTTTVDSCSVDGTSVDVIVFRAAPMFLVAPDFGEDDAGFAAAELRAVWAHALSLPSLTVINRSQVDSWFATSDGSYWRRALATRGAAIAPRKIGKPYSNGHWVRWTGGVGTLPPAAVAERLGTASVAGGTLRRHLICAGAPVDAASSPVHLLARVLLGYGVVLAEVITNVFDQVVSVITLPALSSDISAVVAPRLARWIRADADR